MNERREQRHLFTGILLLGLGLIFLLSNFGLGSWIGLGRWWPLILILIGLIVLFRRTEIVTPAPPGAPGEGTRPGTAGEAAGRGPRRLPLAGLILIGVGAAFLLQDVIPGEVFPALILIAIGGALLLRHWSTR